MQTTTTLADAVLKANVQLRKRIDAYLLEQARRHRPRDIEAGVRLLADQARQDGLEAIISASYIRGFLIAGAIKDQLTHRPPAVHSG